MSRYLLQRITHINRLRCLFSSYPSHQVVNMPSLSPTMTTGTVSSWKKKIGDKCIPGDTIAEIETDKANMAFEGQDDFFIAKLLVAEGSEVAVGSPIMISVEDEASVSAFTDYKVSASASTAPPASSATSSVTATPSPPAAAATTPSTMSNSTATTPSTMSNSTPLASHIMISPAARHLMESRSLSSAGLTATGKGGRVLTKEDVITAINAGKIQSKSKTSDNTTSAATAATKTATPAATKTATPAAPTATTSSPAATASAVSSPTPVPPLTVSNTPINNKYEDIPNTNMRKIIAKRLTESKATVPHFYTSIECEIDDLMKLRKKLKNELDINVSVNDLVIKSAACALRDLPRVNSKWSVKENRVLTEDSSNVAISAAVATPNGLITPIVKSADRSSVSEINAKVRDLATRARDGKLKPEEFQGGSFSVSNLGMFAIGSFSAVINPPQACILAVGAGVTRVLPPLPHQSTSSSSKPRIATTVTVQLSADRRVVTEAEAAEFLQTFRHYFSHPHSILL